MKRGSIAEPFIVNEVHISPLTHVSGEADGGLPPRGCFPEEHRDNVANAASPCPQRAWADGDNVGSSTTLVVDLADGGLRPPRLIVPEEQTRNENIYMSLHIHIP